MFRLLITALLAVVTSAACGGGGNPAPPAPPAPPPSIQVQYIAFADSGPVYGFVGDQGYSNIATGGAGTGATTYASNMPSVAGVDPNTGQVTMVAVGTAQITASKTADTGYMATTASYTLHIAPRVVTVTAWVGPTDTNVSFPSQAQSLDFVRSSALNCDPAAYTTCSAGTQTSLSSTTLVDAVATRTQPAMYWLKHGSHFTTGVVAPEQKFGIQVNLGAVALNGRLWVVTGGFAPPNQVWSSADGANWRLETPSATFPARTAFKLVAFKGALWVIGGGGIGPSSSGVLNDVWTSTDGKTWTQVTPGAAFPARGNFAAAAFNGRLWVAGGANGSGPYYNDVWSSEDGANWVSATTAAAFPGREQHELVSFNSRLWVVGGFSGGIPVGDIWSSTDGVTWTEETPLAAFGRRFADQVVTDGTTLWLIAGRDAYQTAQRDVWSSTDGKTWSPVTANAEFAPRGDHGAAVLNGQLWVIGGGDNEVWSSTGGAHWSKQAVSAVIPSKLAVAHVSYQGRLWVLGEEGQLWSSADGISWAEAIHQVPGSTYYPELLARANQLLLIGGWQYAAPNYYREVWQSADGQNWSQVASTVAFPAENLSQTVDFNGTFLAFAGSSVDSTFPEV